MVNHPKLIQFYQFHIDRIKKPLNWWIVNTKKGSYFEKQDPFLSQEENEFILVLQAIQYQKSMLQMEEYQRLRLYHHTPN